MTPSSWPWVKDLKVRGCSKIICIKTSVKDVQQKHFKKLESLKDQHKQEMKTEHDRFTKEFHECKMFYKTKIKELTGDWTEKNDTLKAFKALLQKNLGKGFNCLMMTTVNDNYDNLRISMRIRFYWGHKSHIYHCFSLKLTISALF